MRITVKQLKSLIREAVRSVLLNEELDKSEKMQIDDYLDPAYHEDKPLEKIYDFAQSAELDMEEVFDYVTNTIKNSYSDYPEMIKLLQQIPTFLDMKEKEARESGR